MTTTHPTFIDLFAGIGGIRLGFEQNEFKCIFSSEWDQKCQKVYHANFHEVPQGDITKIKSSDIPSHDVFCAGFPFLIVCPLRTNDFFFNASSILIIGFNVL